MREVGANAFRDCKRLKSVQLNEGLERLGALEVIDGRRCEGGVFCGAAIESIRIPSTVKRLETETFRSCEDLKHVDIPSGVECIGEQCFYESGVEEVTLPATLREIGEDVFEDCASLRIVYVEEGYTLDVKMYVGDNVEVRRKQVVVL